MAKKKLPKELVLNFTQESLKAMGGDQAIPDEAKAKIKKHAKETAEHFKSNGWDLDYSILSSDLKLDLLSFNPEWLFLEELVKAYGKPVYIHSGIISKEMLSKSRKSKKVKADGTFKIGGKRKSK